jgi:hypothetical protein
MAGTSHPPHFNRRSIMKIVLDTEEVIAAISLWLHREMHFEAAEINIVSAKQDFSAPLTQTRFEIIAEASDIESSYNPEDERM